MVTEGIVARANGGGRERERILYEIFPYELFGVAEYFDRGLKMARISVFSKSTHILKMPWEVCRAIAARYPELTNALGIVMAQRVRLLADALSDSRVAADSRPHRARASSVRDAGARARSVRPRSRRSRSRRSLRRAAR